MHRAPPRAALDPRDGDEVDGQAILAGWAGVDKRRGGVGVRSEGLTNRRSRMSVARVERGARGPQGTPHHLLAPSFSKPQPANQPFNASRNPWSGGCGDLGGVGGPLVGSRSSIWTGASDIRVCLAALRGCRVDVTRSMLTFSIARDAWVSAERSMEERPRGE